MLTGGRVESHLKANLANPYCTILMVGYTAEGTPGHGLLHKKTVNIKGRNLPVTARILRTDIFSGHGDQDDLLAFVKSQKKEKLKKIFLVHGEYDSMLGFKKLLEEEGYGNVEMPKKGETYIL
jgi:metallo-beta-lactamase family protein